MAESYQTRMLLKAWDAIDSCTNRVQLAAAKRFYELAIKRTPESQQANWLAAFDNHWNYKADQLSHENN